MTNKDLLQNKRLSIKVKLAKRVIACRSAFSGFFFLKISAMILAGKSHALAKIV